MEPTQEDSGSPILSQKYDCLSDMVDELIKLGPSESTYSLLFDLVGREKEDVIREKLSSFFQGSATASGSIYSILIEAGKANPIDSEIVGGLMDSHPELFNKNKEDNNQYASSSKNVKYAGLFIPDSYCGTKTNSEKMVKTADSAAFPHYPIGDNLRMCPKIRDVVSTDICRFHCLDGIVVANAEPICGEELWRNNVMDKYSAEHLDKDGKWVGGYLEKRFKTFHDDGGHSMMIKPGNRSNPIHEDAWSTEKRLVELRKSEGKKREYNGVYEPKDLYNFDQHEKGEPKNPQLFAKKPDPISRTASFNLKQTRLANSFENFKDNGNFTTSPGMADPNKTVSKVCANPNCPDGKTNYGININKCPRCNGVEFNNITGGEAAQKSGVIHSGFSDISANLIIKNDLGVFSASKNGITSYASTKEDAIIKLAAELAELEPENIEIADKELSSEIKNDDNGTTLKNETFFEENPTNIGTGIDTLNQEIPEIKLNNNPIDDFSLNTEVLSDETSDNSNYKYIPADDKNDTISDTAISEDDERDFHIPVEEVDNHLDENPLTDPNEIEKLNNSI